MHSRGEVSSASHSPAIRTALLERIRDEEADQALEEALIALWREEIREVMLNRLVAFGLDPAFQQACRGLSSDADMTLEEAASHLYPVAREVYEGACRGSD